MKHAEAREQALSALYAADSRSLDQIDTTKISKRAGLLAEGTWIERAEIDEIITEAASNWRIERMPVVDRNILRLGVHELREKERAVGIVISEAVELAKKYSTGKSAPFINGVLAAVAKAISDADPKPET